jgi:hypothetical protein
MNVSNHLIVLFYRVFCAPEIHYCYHFTGGNIICLDFWGRKCGPFIYALHFSLSLGLLVGPFVIEPLAQTHVPKMVQNIALPKSLQENTTSVETVVATTKAYHDLYKHHHKIIKRGISNLKFLNESHAMASKHPQRIPSIPKLKTPDPLLAKLFATTNIMHKRLVTKPTLSVSFISFLNNVE